MKAVSILFILIMLCGIPLNYRFLRAMRRHHPTMWQSVGRPTLFSVGGSLMLSLPVLRMLWSKDYRQVGDPQFSRVGDFVRSYQLLLLCLYVSFALVVLMHLWRSHAVI
jgi:hypothetical protein